jgi:hypothetical protein
VKLLRSNLAFLQRLFQVVDAVPGDFRADRHFLKLRQHPQAHQPNVGNMRAAEVQEL